MWILSWILGLGDGAGGDPESGTGKACEEPISVVVIAEVFLSFFHN